jgi:hypothetical protein
MLLTALSGSVCRSKMDYTRGGFLQMWKKAIACFLFVFAVFYTIVELFLEEGFFNIFVPISAVTIGVMLLQERRKEKDKNSGN